MIFLGWLVVAVVGATPPRRRAEMGTEPGTEMSQVSYVTLDAAGGVTAGAGLTNVRRDQEPLSASATVGVTPPRRHAEPGLERAVEPGTEQARLLSLIEGGGNVGDSDEWTEADVLKWVNTAEPEVRAHADPADFDDFEQVEAFVNRMEDRQANYFLLTDTRNGRQTRLPMGSNSNPLTTEHLGTHGSLSLGGFKKWIEAGPMKTSVLGVADAPASGLATGTMQWPEIRRKVSPDSLFLSLPLIDTAIIIKDWNSINGGVNLFLGPPRRADRQRIAAAASRPTGLGSTAQGKPRWGLPLRSSLIAHFF